MRHKALHALGTLLMGREVRPSASIADADVEGEFHRRLSRETMRLRKWCKDGRFENPSQHIGQEVEFCLTDHSFLPLSINQKFLGEINDPYTTSELAAFNVEFNPPKVSLAPGAIVVMKNRFEEFMQTAFNVAEKMSAHLVMVGILPTISPGDLGAPMITRKERYKSLLKKFEHWQDGRYCTISIKENDGLELGLSTILMEAVTTSQQIHIQVPDPGSAAYYNSAQILSGPMVAAGSNSPLFLGRKLWEETRVPLFEQILAPRFDAPGIQEQGDCDFFGHSYVEESIVELFEQNSKSFAIALAELYDDDKRLPHLALQNGTIWRWNRPVFELDENKKPTLRIEHRVLPTGTTNIDMCANIALFSGAMMALANDVIGDAKGSELERRLPAKEARNNFYKCARDGLQARVTWFDGRKLPVKKLLLDEIIPLARRKLGSMGMQEEELGFLDIVTARVETGRTGSRWQRDYIKSHGSGSANIRNLTGTYWRHQIQGMPVHKWMV